jgi:hypothetical protein
MKRALKIVGAALAGAAIYNRDAVTTAARNTYEGNMDMATLRDAVSFEAPSFEQTVESAKVAVGLQEAAPAPSFETAMNNSAVDSVKATFVPTPVPTVQAAVNTVKATFVPAPVPTVQAAVNTVTEKAAEVIATVKTAVGVEEEKEETPVRDALANNGTTAAASATAAAAVIGAAFKRFKQQQLLKAAAQEADKLKQEADKLKQEATQALIDRHVKFVVEGGGDKALAQKEAVNRYRV